MIVLINWMHYPTQLPKQIWNEATVAAIVGFGIGTASVGANQSDRRMVWSRTEPFPSGWRMAPSRLQWSQLLLMERCVEVESQKGTVRQSSRFIQKVAIFFLSFSSYCSGRRHYVCRYRRAALVLEVIDISTRPAASRTRASWSQIESANGTGLL